MKKRVCFTCFFVRIRLKKVKKTGDFIVGRSSICFFVSSSPTQLAIMDPDKKSIEAHAFSRIVKINLSYGASVLNSH